LATSPATYAKFATEPRRRSSQSSGRSVVTERC